MRGRPRSRSPVVLAVAGRPRRHDSAADEYGWPRLLRLRIYYDGSALPSVDSPVGDFFAVGHGFERRLAKPKPVLATACPVCGVSRI